MPMLTHAIGNILFGRLSEHEYHLPLSFDVFRYGQKVPSAVVIGSQEGSGWPFQIILPAATTFANGPSIIVKIHDTDNLLDIHQDLKGFVNDINEVGVSIGHLMENKMFFYPIERTRGTTQIPQSMIDHTAGAGTQESFKLIGYATVLDLLKFGVVSSPADKVFELGCGCGRIAYMLSTMLDEQIGGSYSGFDIWSDGIDWATQHITSLYPHATFVRLGKHNEYAANVSYPINLPDNSQDSFIAASVFTHLRVQAANDYAAAIARILKPSGKGYITFFASKEHFRGFSSAVCDEDEYSINFANTIAEDTFVDEKQAISMFERHGLSVLGIKYGSWRGSQYAYRGYAGGQDLMVIKKR
ncbi:MAG: class I SAM-dependent methyltransferase [Methylocella sp.]